MKISELKNKELMTKFSLIVTQEKEAIAVVVAHLAEIDKRKLYLEEAYSSLFEFCVKKYNFSEQAAQSSCANTTRMRETIKPVTANRYKIELSCSEELTQKIKRAKEVLRHKFPEGKLEDVLEEALEALLEKKDPLRKLRRRGIKNVILSEAKNPVIQRRDPRIKCGAGSSPSAQDDCRKTKVTIRYIPQAIKSAVWKRDGGQCTYVSSEGKRCSERGALELDHIHPYALGGEHTVHNLRLQCRNHNQQRAIKTFGLRQWPKFSRLEHRSL